MSYSKYDRYESTWSPYVPVAERKKNASQLIEKARKKGQVYNPIVIEGRTIAKTFWGKAWCENLEYYSDFANRLPRGRTYVRNGSVIDLKIEKGSIKSLVMGSSLYKVAITIKPMPEGKWKDLVVSCSGKIESLIELLQGKFSKSVMSILTEKEKGLFPKPREIVMDCSCPDSAGMCKHIAAVLYGVGACLDKSPEYLFQLRHVDHMDMLSIEDTTENITKANTIENVLADGDLSALFGIELDANFIAQQDPAPAMEKKKRNAAPKKASSVVEEKPKKPKMRRIGLDKG